MNDVTQFDQTIANIDDLCKQGSFLMVGYQVATMKDVTVDKTQLKQLEVDFTEWSDKIVLSLAADTDRSYYGSMLTLATFAEVHTPAADSFLPRIAKRLETLIKVLASLEERRNTLVRLEVAKIEHDKSDKYWLDYDKRRQLTLNGVLLAKPHFNSENDIFLSFIFNENNQGRAITIDELEQQAFGGEKLIKKPHQILRDVGLDGDVQQVFFDGISNKGFKFRQSVTYALADENDLPVLDFNKIGRISQK